MKQQLKNIEKNNKKCIDGANVNYAKRCKDYKKSARTAGTVADVKKKY